MPRKPKQIGEHLTVRQEALAVARVANPNATLVQLAGMSGYSGSQAVHATLNNKHVQARIREIMNMSPKLQVPALLAKLEEGLDAKETKFFSHLGEVVSEREVVDYKTRQGYLDTALELHGAKEKVAGDVVNNFFSKEAIEAFVEAFKRTRSENP